MDHGVEVTVRQDLGFGDSVKGSCSKKLRLHPPGAWGPQKLGLPHPQRTG